MLQTLCKYYEKLLCCKSDLSVFLSLPQPHSLVCLHLLVWCNTFADKCTLKLFPLVLHSFAGKLQPDRYVQLASWHNCLPCNFPGEVTQCFPVESSQAVKRHWIGSPERRKGQENPFGSRGCDIRLLGQDCVSSRGAEGKTVRKEPAADE